ncbi:male-enhanced antigen 1 [Fopius arisanus]|uniref:Male-enhanced antigen 1 n=2 Tax=Fopius arisanus TaxID=64838 RepID=A0A9R1UAV8_9HYME|nr:PREDICTED: male-enhanced antigen 1 [Fopius arisanus]
MSPEPTQEPIEQNLKAPNLNVEEPAADSDSEDEDFGAAGYIPLSQVPTDADTLLDDDEDDDWMPSSNQQPYAVPEDEVHEPENPETLQVWSSSSTASNIDLDADKISQVKSAMAKFTLPVDAIPEWAQSVSEEQWKNRLIDKIKEMQKRD